MVLGIGGMIEFVGSLAVGIAMHASATALALGASMGLLAYVSGLYVSERAT